MDKIEVIKNCLYIFLIIYSGFAIQDNWQQINIIIEPKNNNLNLNIDYFNSNTNLEETITFTHYDFIKYTFLMFEIVIYINIIFMLLIFLSQNSVGILNLIKNDK